MNTKRLLIGSTFLLVVGLMIGSAIYPDSPLMWLADTSPLYMVIRAVILVMLVSLLVSSPPRALAFRLILAGCAVTLCAVAIPSLFAYHINIVDTLVFFEIAIIFALEALEPQQQSVRLAGITPTNIVRRRLLTH